MSFISEVFFLFFLIELYLALLGIVSVVYALLLRFNKVSKTRTIRSNGVKLMEKIRILVATHSVFLTFYIFGFLIISLALLMIYLIGKAVPWLDIKIAVAIIVPLSILGLAVFIWTMINMVRIALA